MEETASDDAEREDGVDSVVLGEFEVKDEGGGIEDRATISVDFPTGAESIMQ